MKHKGGDKKKERVRRKKFLVRVAESRRIEPAKRSCQGRAEIRRHTRKEKWKKKSKGRKQMRKMFNAGILG